MNKIIIKDDIRPRFEDLLNLYNDLQWTAYTDEPGKLKKGIDSSLKV